MIVGYKIRPALNPCPTTEFSRERKFRLTALPDISDLTSAHELLRLLDHVSNIHEVIFQDRNLPFNSSVIPCGSYGIVRIAFWDIAILRQVILWPQHNDVRRIAFKQH